jgi:hypothetical protein
MVGHFRAQDGTLLRLTTPQVTGTLSDRLVGFREAGCSTVAGKSLARMSEWSVPRLAGHVPPCPDDLRPFMARPGVGVVG